MRCLLVPLAFLSACAGVSQPVWLKPGAPAFQAERDLVACGREAGARFPERPRITTAPSVTLGGGFCDGAVCIGVNNRADVFDYDTNIPLRDRAVAACMGARGYGLTTLPACPAGPVRMLESQPFDTRGLCVAQGRIAAP